MRFMSAANIAGRLLAVLILPVTLFVSTSRAETLAETGAVAVRLRIGIVTEGLVRITPSDLAGAGVDPATVDPRAFAMTSMGEPIAIRVTGEADGHFDPADRIEFFGQPFRSVLPGALDRQQEEKYTDERVYWLDIGGAGGLRVAENVDGTPQRNLTPPTHFPATLHAEVNSVWTSLWSLNYDTRDTWYWERIGLPSAGVTTTTRSYPFLIPYPAPGFPAAVRLEVLPVTTRTTANPGGTNPSHRVAISLGGQQLGELIWDGLIRQVITGTAAAGALTATTTGLDVQVSIQAPSTKEAMYINFWELDYRRLFRAYDDRLDFRAETAGLQEFSATDFASGPVTVWDVTVPAQPKRLSGVAVTSGAGSAYTARFRANPAAGDRFWMQGEASFSVPASTALRSDTGLRAPARGADTVIVTPAFLRPAAETLAAWHRAHGRRTLVADLQDVYDEFNDGIRHPKAVRHMLAWAAVNWTAPAPIYLVLLGDGHFNLKNYPTASSYYAPAVNPLPPYLIFKDPWQGEIAADGLYGDYTGDDLPDVAVGRIPVNILDEANVAVAKITGYDENGRLLPWQQRTLFVADEIDPLAGDFWQLSDDIILGHTPADLAAQRVYYGAKTPAPAYPTYGNAADAKTALLSAVNSGAFMVQYTGHGAPQYWSKQNLWTVADSALLANGAQLPIILSFNCFDGYFTYSSSTYQSLAETMFRQAGGGSVAAIAPSGEGLTNDQTAFRKILLDTLFKDGVRELGRAFLIAKQTYSGTYGVNYYVYEMNLFGDPAMRLPVSGHVPQAPAVAMARTGINEDQVALSWGAVTQNLLGENTSVTSYSIWRSTRPDFDPDAANCNCVKVAEITGASWTDDGSIGPIVPIGDVRNNYFYVVRAKNSAGWSPAVVRTGEFDFALQPGP